MHRARQERAAIAEEKKREEKKQRTTTSSFNPISAKSEPIYYSTQRMDGTGMWVQPSIRHERIDLPIAKPKLQNLNTEIEAKVAEDMANMLQERIFKLNEELSEATSIKTSTESKVAQLEQELAMIVKEKDEFQDEIHKIQGKRVLMEREMDEFAIFRNYRDTHISSLQKETENEKERADAYKLMYEEAARSKEEEISEYEEEMLNVQNKMQELTVQNAQLFEFIKKLQEENEMLSQHQTIVPKKEFTEKNLKLNSLINENKTLQAMIKELEQGRSAHHELVRKVEEENKNYKAEIVNLKKKIKREQGLKKHQTDLANQRESKIALIEERYSQLETQISILTQQQNDVKENKTRSKIIAINADPHLFE